MESQTIIFAFAITLFAGLATGIGSAIAFVAHRMSRSAISFALGLSAGVMIYISFVELFAEAQSILSTQYDEKIGVGLATLSLFGGIALIWIIDFIIPEYENPHEIREVSNKSIETNPKGAKRLGLMTALAIAIHNFPEGVSTFVTAIESPSLGVAIGFAIALHNIPEGIAVSVPIYQATGSRTKAFWYSFLSGLSEPIGAVITYFVLAPYINEHLMGIILASVAGVMIYVSIDELLPAARSYGKHHASIFGVIVGMGIMALTLIYMA
ncbi:MAG: zinc transporter ZupT [Rikenellaceae bacterium]